MKTSNNQQLPFPRQSHMKGKYLDQFHAFESLYKCFLRFWRIMEFVTPYDPQYDLHFFVNFHASEWIEVFDTQPTMKGQTHFNKYLWVPQWKLTAVSGLLLKCVNPQCRCFVFCPF